MKILLDENIPKNLKRDLSEYEVATDQEMGWNGLQNGALLSKMLATKMDVLITADKNLQNQQNFNTYPIPVILLNVIKLTYSDIQPMTPKLLELLQSELKPGCIMISVG